MGGFRGLSLAAGADSEWLDRLEAYRLRLTGLQRVVFDGLADETQALRYVPAYAFDAMAPYGPWPDPFSDWGGEDG